MSGYEIGAIFFICIAALVFVYRTVCLIISRRRVKRLSVLRVKYPIRDINTVFFALAVAAGVFMVITGIINIPRDLAVLEDYWASFSQDPERYGELIEITQRMIFNEKYQIVCGMVVVVMDLLAIFTRGAYITNEGVVLFGGFNPLQTTARIEQGSIKFYTRTSREAEKHRKYQYAFDLPENEDNCELFKDFIKTTGANA